MSAKMKQQQHIPMPYGKQEVREFSFASKTSTNSPTKLADKSANNC